MHIQLKDDNVRAATGFVGATTKLVRAATCLVRPATCHVVEEIGEAEANVDLAFRRSCFAAFVALKSVSLDVEMLEGKGLVHQHQA